MILADNLNEFLKGINLAWEAPEGIYIMIALVIPFVVWMLRKSAANLVLKLVKAIGKGLGLAVRDDFDISFAPAVRVLLVATSVVIANDAIQLPEPFYSIIDKFLISICVAAVFVAIYAQCVYIPQLLKKGGKKHEQDHLDLIVRVAQFVVVLLCIAAIMKVWGIDIGPALTGMGVAGAAMALASQDYLKNLLGGFNNAAERRFRVGDVISANGLVEGTVESVELRSTLIRRFDSSPVHVPNSELANAAIINHGRRLRRRIYWKVALTYSTPVEALRDIRQQVMHYIEQNERFVPADEANLFVRVDSLNESSVNMLVYCFTRSTEYGDYLEAKEELALKIKSIVHDAGGSFAFPSRSIYVETSEKESIELDSVKPS
jgi:MscS family membrane protein